MKKQKKKVRKPKMPARYKKSERNFKTKEELIKENTGDGFWKGSIDSHDGAIKDGINKAFNSFKECIEFYKKWKGKNPMMLSEIDFLNYRDWIRTKTKSKIQEKILMEDFPIDDDWLFNYCFGDIE